jgi:hypothetical protein
MKLPKGRVTLAAAAVHVDLSARGFGELLDAGVITRHEPGRGYVLDEVRVQYIRHIRGRASGHGDGATLSAERAKLAAEQRETAALRNATTRGDLVSVKEIVTAFTGDLVVHRDLLLGIPGKAANDCEGKTRAEIEAILVDEINSALAALSDPRTYARRGNGSPMGGSGSADQGPQAAA